nr:hypothetical protein [Endozoicomonas ascidiicola]
MSLESLCDRSDEAIASFRRLLEPVRKTLEWQLFLSGEQAAGADYILLVFRKVKTTGFSRSALAMIFCRSYLDVEVLRWTTGMAVKQYLIFSTTLCLSRSTGIRCSREMLA